MASGVVALSQCFPQLTTTTVYRKHLSTCNYILKEKAEDEPQNDSLVEVKYGEK